MGLHVRRLLENAPLTPDAGLDLSQALDLGDYREVHLVLTVNGAGDGGEAKLVVRHAAVNEASCYLDFETPAEIALNATGQAWFHADTFTRWVCWSVSGTLLAEARVTLDLVAKS